MKVSAFLFLLVLGLSNELQAAPHRLAVISDLNGGYGSTEYNSNVGPAVHRVISWHPDAILCSGDMVAGESLILERPQMEKMWNAFHSLVTNKIKDARIPFAPSPGNHDASAYHGFETEREIYKEQWSARKPDLDFVDDSHYPLYYAFKIGNALIISLDSTVVDPLPEGQKKWILKTLDAHPELKTKILFGHVPLLPFTHGREQEYLHDPQFEKDLVARKLTLWISGHDHGYYPARRPGGLRLVSMACQGDGPRPLIGSTARSPRSVLMVEFDDTGITKIDAYGGPGFDQLISRESLPRSLNAGTLKVIRDDL